MLRAQQVERFDADGFLNAGPLLEHEEVEELRSEVDRILETGPPRPWPMKKGELSFHHSLNWHGSPANRSNFDRRAIAIQCMTGETLYRADGDHPMKEFVEVEDGGPMSAAGPQRVHSDPNPTHRPT